MNDIAWPKVLESVDRLYALSKKDNIRNQPLTPLEWLDIGIVLSALTLCYQTLTVERFCIAPRKESSSTTES